VRRVDPGDFFRDSRHRDRAAGVRANRLHICQPIVGCSRIPSVRRIREIVVLGSIVLSACSPVPQPKTVPTADDVAFNEFLSDARGAHDLGRRDGAIVIGRIAVWHDADRPEYEGGSRQDPHSGPAMLLSLGAPVFCPGRSFFIAKIGCQGRPVGTKRTSDEQVREFFKLWATSPREIRTIIYLVSKVDWIPPYVRSDRSAKPGQPKEFVDIPVMETRVRVIDRLVHGYYGEKFFRFDSLNLPSGTSGPAIYPDDEVLDYLVGLPRRRQ
jgi:hypothetical protein